MHSRVRRGAARIAARGQRYWAAHLRAELSQEALGYEAGMHRTFISEVERGLRNPSVWTLHRLAKALGVRVRDLV